MKALDTPVLLALLEGNPAARDLVRRLRGVELITTEANLLELAWIAARGPPRLRGRRRGVLGRLRRKITVFPIDARAVGESERRLAQGWEGSSPLVEAMVGALSANGCEELLTSDPRPDLGRVPFKVTRFDKRHVSRPYSVT